jgi:hypothetical protein
MQNVPHIVRERLKAGVGAGAHPDADVLNAFAERLLSEPERSTVLTHLSACADCRDILALALPATQEVPTAAFAVRRGWFTWPTFRWGFATAGIVVIALGIVEFERHLPAHSATVARQLAPAPIAAGMQKEVAPAPPTLASGQNAPDMSTSIANPSVAKKTTNSLAEAERRPHHLPAELHGPTPQRLQASAPALVANQHAPSPPPSSASQMVEVQAQSVPLKTQTADSQIAKASPANGLAEQFFGYNSGPLTRAKPADIEPVQAGAMGPTSRWSITAVGGLQRSFDQGKTWQDIDVNVNASTAPVASGASGMAGPMTTPIAKQKSMPAASASKVSTTPIFFRAVTAAGNEVWAGGSNAALFHSIDGGNHWTRVLPSSTDAVLTGDVVSVEFSDPQHGTVTTSTPEIWTTTDGGQAWQEQ